MYTDISQLIIYLLKAHSIINCTGSSSGLFTSSNLTQVEYNTKHAHYNIYKRKTYKRNPKVSPFGIALVKKWPIKLGDAGTIDRFSLAF